ncbi:MAG: hypothetical protein ABJ084_09070 [Halioglobus sp.]
MQHKDERKLIYASLLVTCSVISLVMGLATGLWTMFQMVVVVELLFWIGAPVQSRHDGRTG